ncbi:hypothetical protein N665_0762s0001 [Sinapis alba]|nr:hypothetical protein N665_0762s0001 [Sinapis alba]
MSLTNFLSQSLNLTNLLVFQSLGNPDTNHKQHQICLLREARATRTPTSVFSAKLEQHQPLLPLSHLR